MVARAAAEGQEAEAVERRRTLGALPWIAVYTDHLRHPKCIELAAELGDPRAALHVAAVWYFFAERFAGGSMPDRSALVIALEAAALWPGEPGELVAAMVKVGLLDRRRRRLAVHDWDTYQSAHVERRARDRAYQRRRRAELKSSSRENEGAKPSKPPEPKEKARPDVVPTSPFASPSPSPSPSTSRTAASDGRRSEPSQSTPPLKGNGLDVGDDAEAQAILRLLPAKAVDVAAALDLPRGAVDTALEDFRRRGLVRLSGGLTPRWELA